MTAATKPRPCGCGCGNAAPFYKTYIYGHAPSQSRRCECGCGLPTSHPSKPWHDGHGRARQADEFWARTAPADGCLEWTGHTNDKGYGVVKWENQDWGAHRLAWTLTFGPIPDGMWVLHHCDNPPCVNAPGGCLYLGDHEQNVADKVERGRQVDGERHGRAKLTAAQVEEIRQRYIFPSYEGAHDSNARALAEEFGVDRKQIQRLARGETWKRP